MSAALRPDSVPDQGLRIAIRTCQLCASLETIDDLPSVLNRGKFDRYLGIESRRAFSATIRRVAQLFEVPEISAVSVVPACRDPKDEKFLTLDSSAGVDVLVSSDEDLLVLHPWHGIPIVRPAEFLKMLDPKR